MSELICHIHAGMPKTGTTSIQNTFSKIDLGDIQYLPFENDNHSPYFANLFENAPWKHRSNVQFDRSRDEVILRKRSLRRRLENMLDAAAADPDINGIMFSGERLGTNGRCNAVAMGRFRDFFRPWCKEFRVYGYVRPLASLLPSDFQQRLQIGGPAIFDLDWIYPNYTDRFQKHDIVFGHPYVSLKRFTRGDLNDGDVVSDLMDQMDIQKPDTEIAQTNITMSREATALLFTMKRAGMFAGSDRDTSVALRETSYMLKGIKGKKLVFDPRHVEKLLEKHKVDIRWIESRIGASVSTLSSKETDFVRHADDLIEIADAAKDLLDALVEDHGRRPAAVHPTILKQKVEEGLMAKF